MYILFDAYLSLVGNKFEISVEQILQETCDIDTRGKGRGLLKLIR